jgi:hypothetical protein
MRALLVATALAVFLLAPAGAMAQNTEPQLTAEQRMRARYPQPVRVGDLIGLPVLDDNARTLGYVRKIVRTNENKIELIVDYRGFLNWRSRPSCRASGGRGHSRPPDIFARHAAERVRIRANLAERRGADTACRLDDQDRALATLRGRGESSSAVRSCTARNHDLVKPITFWCLPTCRQ